MKTTSIAGLIFLVFLFSLKTYSQSMMQTTSQYQGTMQHFQKIKKLANKKKVFDLDFEDIKGSPYLYEEPKLGKLYIQDSLIETAYYQLNLYSDEIEVTENNQLYGILKIKDTKLVFDNQSIYLKEFVDKEENSKEGYFVELWKSNSLSLFQKKNCKLIPPLQAATPNQKDREAKFVVFDNYYLKNPNQKNLVKIKNSKNAMLKLMSTNKKEIKQYMYDHDIDLKNAKDMVKLFSYYDSLQTL